MEPLNKNSIVYISGPMTGFQDSNHQAFLKMEEKLNTRYGCIIHNPATQFGGRQNLQRHVYMRHSTHLLQQTTDVVFLHNWYLSQGARFECLLAQELKLNRWLWDEEKDQVKPLHTFVISTLDIHK